LVSNQLFTAAPASSNVAVMRVAVTQIGVRRLSRSRHISFLLFEAEQLIFSVQPIFDLLQVREVSLKR
jgi:hypothetical protein